MNRTPHSIGDYDAVMDPLHTAGQIKSGNHPGVPAKAAQALLALIEAEAPPTPLFLDDDNLGWADQKRDAMKIECRWALLTPYPISALPRKCPRGAGAAGRSSHGLPAPGYNADLIGILPMFADAAGFARQAFSRLLRQKSPGTQIG